MSVTPVVEPVCSISPSTPAIATIVDARPRDVGGFAVRRVLPSVARRLVGPFAFFDHMGPAALAPGVGLDVPPHPHIGLATVTYLFDGEILHRDSLGSHQPIRPGDVNWMTAGHGIVHSERTAPERRQQGSRLHGLQPHRECRPRRGRASSGAPGWRTSPVTPPSTESARPRRPRTWRVCGGASAR
jgi:pirin-like protein